MDQRDKQAFAVIITGLGAAFRTTVERETMAVFFHYLQSYPLEAVQHAVDQAITNDDRFPVVKRLREYANAYRPSVAHLIPQAQSLIAEFPGEVETGPPADIEAFFEGLGKSVEMPA